MQDPTAQPDDPAGLPATDAAPAASAPEHTTAHAESSALPTGSEDLPATAAAAPHSAGETSAPASEAPPADAADGAPVQHAEAAAHEAEAGADRSAGSDTERAPKGGPDPAAAPAAIPEMSPAACAARLAALFPALFKGQPKPLKLRIQADIQQRAPGVFTRRTLSAFLHRHTTTTAYLIALSQAKERFDLDGAPAGELADEHRQAAVAELARRRAVHEERHAAENAAPDQARRERALLLRAFETSTLTRANFCALKRIDEAELDALLATARQEAVQAGFDQRPPRPVEPARPPRPPGEHRPGGERRDARGGAGRAGGPRPDSTPRRPPHGRPPR
jgi:sRNA-binding protein